MKKLNKRAGGLEVKAIGEDGTFSGYGAVFGNVDSWGDIIAPGAFAESLSMLKAKGRLPAMLWGHDADHPIGVWTDMREDAKGLYVEGRLLINDVAKAKEAHALLKAGGISGLSIGFISKNWTWDEQQDARTLNQIDLWEVSLVTFPANDEARVSDVKSIEQISTVRDLERFLREEGGFSKSCAPAILAKARTVLRREAGEQKAMEAIAAQLSANTSIIARRAKEMK